MNYLAALNVGILTAVILLLLLPHETWTRRGGRGEKR